MCQVKGMEKSAWRLEYHALEGEVVAQILCTKCRLPLHQYQVTGAQVLKTGHQAPEEEVEAVVSPSANTTEENTSQTSDAEKKPRVGTARLQHMQMFFAEMRAVNEEKESRKAARHAEKENRRAQRQAERQALLEERRKMHDEKMDILRQAFGLPK
ncbi:hypothetical protein MTO96_033350 [Rhipicephalus appendiculatus]